MILNSIEFLVPTQTSSTMSKLTQPWLPTWPTNLQQPEWPWTGVLSQKHVKGSLSAVQFSRDPKAKPLPLQQDYKSRPGLVVAHMSLLAGQCMDHSLSLQTMSGDPSKALVFPGCLDLQLHRQGNGSYASSVSVCVVSILLLTADGNNCKVSWKQYSLTKNIS